MPLVVVCSTKGGTGKTTLAFNLAERAWASGLRVLLVDCDYQEAAIGLSLQREVECWPVSSGSVSLAGAGELRALRNGGEYDLVICDLPGSQSMTLGRVLSEADLVLSPVGVGSTDEMAAANMLRLVSGMSRGIRLVFVPSHFPRGRRRLEGLVESLRDRGAEVCPVVFQDRVAHVDSFTEGLGVCEKAPDSPAAEDVRRMWDWLLRDSGLDIEVMGGGSDGC